MYCLAGFTEYKRVNHTQSVFKTAMASNSPWCIHLHGKPPVTAQIIENNTYDIVIDSEETGQCTIKKLFVHFLYPPDMQEKILPLIKKVDKKVKKMNQEPTENLKDRHFVKNKTLYPLMKEREVLFFTLLDGTIIRGLVQGFTMFDITVGMKGGVPLTFLRHSLYDVKNKAGRCFLKSVQETSQDWKKSPLYVDAGQK